MGGSTSWVVAGDYRRYLRTSLRSAFAFRALGYYAGGDPPAADQYRGSGHCAATRSTGTSPAAAYGWSTASGAFPITDFLSIGFRSARCGSRCPGRVLRRLGRAWPAATVDRGTPGAPPRVADADWPAARAAARSGLSIHSGVVDGYALPAPTHGTRFVDFSLGLTIESQWLVLDRSVSCPTLPLARCSRVSPQYRPVVQCPRGNRAACAGRPEGGPRVDRADGAGAPARRFASGFSPGQEAQGAGRARRGWRRPIRSGSTTSDRSA